MWNSECEINSYLAICRYCPIQSELNRIFQKNFNFLQKTEFGEYDGIKINSFTSGENNNMVVNFQITFESSGPLSDIIKLYDESLTSFEDEMYQIIVKGQTCDRSCSVTQNVPKKEPIVEVTWFTKSSIISLIEETDECLGPDKSVTIE